MSLFKRGLTAKQLARDFGVNLNDFTARVDALLTRLSEAEASMPVPERRREVCTAIWAAITASVESSALSSEERAKVMPLLQQVLIPYWLKHCATEPEMAVVLSERATLYLKGRDEKSQVATASAIVTRLLEAIGTAQTLKPKLTKALIPMFAHRMLGDVHYINDVKMRFGIELPMFAAFCVTAEVMAACEPAFRMLRIS